MLPPPRAAAVCRYGAACPWHRIRKCLFSHTAESEVRGHGPALAPRLADVYTIPEHTTGIDMQYLLGGWAEHVAPSTFDIEDPSLSLIRRSSDIYVAAAYAEPDDVVAMVERMGVAKCTGVSLVLAALDAVQARAPYLSRVRFCTRGFLRGRDVD